jgi:hypothetical protein
MTVTVSGSNVVFNDSTTQNTAFTGTATNLAGGSNGTIPYQTASGTTAMLAVGTSGQVLTSAGSGTPTWSTLSSGAMTLISTQNLSGQTDVTFTTGISSTYKVYKLFMQLYNPGQSTWAPQIRIYAGGVDTNYAYGYKFTTGSPSYTSTTGQTAVNLSNGAAGQNQLYAWDLEITLYTYGNRTDSLHSYALQGYVVGVSAFGTILTSATFGYDGGSGNNVAITGISILTAGVTVNGTVSLYGVSS